MRDLIRNVKHSENVDEWTKSYGIGDPIVVKPWRPNWNEDIDDDQHFDMKYFPHQGRFFSRPWHQGEFTRPYQKSSVNRLLFLI